MREREKGKKNRRIMLLSSSTIHENVDEPIQWLRKRGKANKGRGRERKIKQRVNKRSLFHHSQQIVI
jgi:hypothetical protein